MTESVDKVSVRTATRECPVTVIEARGDWRLFDWQEMVRYKDLLYFLVLRDVTVLYKQTVLGVAWAVLTPFFSMFVFTIIFGMLLKVPSDGRPYALFSFAALLPWTYFSQSLTGASNSLIQGTSLFTKVYFPRVFIPLVPVFSKLLDFAIASVMLVLMMVWYRVAPSHNVIFLPLLLAIMMLTSAGIGMFLSALAVQYRDVRHAMGFLVQILMYAAPVVWPVSKIPEDLRLWYGLYPMAGVIEGFRASLLNTAPMPWDLIAMGMLAALIFFLIGAVYFRRTERSFADVA
ncbi:MAG TPA: ABC transporter permease [Clostridia bacterium]|nr:ABC transporter permease [Clostridia bacterium]